MSIYKQYEVNLGSRLDVEKKKVMFFIYRLSYGGAARTMMNIVNHLDREKFEPMLVTLDYTFDYEQNLAEDVTFIKLETKRLRSAIKPLAKLIQEEQPHILFSTIPNYNTIATLAKLMSRTRTKIVVREAAFLGGSFKEDLKLLGYGFVYKFSKRVIALSEGVKANLVSKYRVKEDKVEVIYNPVDLKYINQAKDEPLINEHATIFKGNQKNIITAGRLVKEKDQATLIRAFQLVTQKVDANLVLLGEGHLENSLKTLVKELGLEDKVHFLGFQKNPYQLFYHADAFALTSLTEGFGHVLVEAMATSTPVVSTRCSPGGEEVLANGEYGKLCDVGDVNGIAQALVAVLQMEAAEKALMIEKGEMRARNFAVEEIVKQYEEMFLKV